MEALPLPEPGHNGYLVQEHKRALVVDAPLDTDAVAEFLPGFVKLVAVVETGIPAGRVAGGRLLAEATGARLYGPGAALRGAVAQRDGTRIEGFPEARSLAAPGIGDADVALLVGELLFVGGLDGADWAPDAAAADRVQETRIDLAARFPRHTAHGSAGSRPAAELAMLDPPRPGPAPLNADAVLLTNQGRADMFWADPRFGDDAPSVDDAYLQSRSASPWAPMVVDLRAEPDRTEAALAVAPGRLASEIGRLEANRQIVVRADDEATARAAAGFLRRLGMSAAWATSRRG